MSSVIERYGARNVGRGGLTYVYLTWLYDVVSEVCDDHAEVFVWR